MRAWFPYAQPQDEIVVVVNMLSLPNRRFVWTADAGRVAPLAAPPSIGDGNPHGSYHWAQDTSLLSVKLTGGKSLEMRTESAVQVGAGKQS